MILSAVLTILALLFIWVLIEFLLLCIRLGSSGLKELYINLNKIAPPPNFPASQNSTIRILVVGDSTATGSGAKPEESIAGCLALKFNASVQNLGQNGARLVDVLAQMDSVANENFDLVLIMAGNNDIVRFTSLREVRHFVGVLADKAKKIGKHVVMLRGGNMGNFPFFPLSISWAITKRSHQVRKICEEVTLRKGILYVELFMQRKEDFFLKDPNFYYTPDLIHLNGRGYDVWFKYLMKEMEKAKYEI